ncbi:MAG TPA: acyl-CoA synthetase, partial [Actinomycetota bacterium]|nr:acyl-CoA synthetase [Actinomycetota bacterium]
MGPDRFNFTRDVVEAQDPGKLAVRFCDKAGSVRDLTFGDIGDSAARWAGVVRRSVSPGDRMLVLVGKTPDWFGVMLGGLKMGAVAIPCSEMLRAKDLDFRVRHSGAGLLVADPGSRAEVEAMAESPEIVYVGEAELGDTDRETADTAADDNAFILYTSGTTKDPKGVVHTHRYTWAKRAQAERWLDAKPDDLVWCTAGTGWAKSIWNVLLGPWSCGSAVILHEGGFEPEERFRLIGDLGVTVLCQAPTEYRLMAKLDDLGRFDVSGVRHAVSAGEPLNPEVIR